MENVFAALTAKIAESGKGRCLTVPPHTTHHAGPQWAVRRNHQALAG